VNPDSHTYVGMEILTSSIHQMVQELGKADADRVEWARENAMLTRTLNSAHGILLGSADAYKANVPFMDKGLVEQARERMNELTDAKRVRDARQQTITKLMDEANELEDRINKALDVVKDMTNPLAEEIREALDYKTTEENK
jgi:hypothetical protein